MDHMQALNTLASERYLLGEMTELERHAFEDHFFSCNECAEDVRAGALMREGAKAGFAASGQARPAERGQIAAFRPRASRRLSTALPWAVAAMLTAVAAYQSLWVLPDLRQQVAPQALSPIALRPATRGTDPVVRLVARHPVTLAMEVNVPGSSSELSYDLRTAGGASVLAGRAPAPAAGAPLLLLVPNSAFRGPGRYSLRLGDSTNPDTPLGEYRFVVETP
jgi:anti-sigma factor RsiW